MAERFMSVNPDIMEPGEFYSTFTNKDNATLIIKKDVQDAVNDDVATMKETQNGLVLDITNAKDDINNLETSTTNLETNITNLGTDVTTLEIENATNKTDISALKTDNVTNKTNISSLQTDNTTNKSDISTLKSDNTTNKSNISSLQSDNTINKSDISTLKIAAEGINPSPVGQCWVSSNGLDTNNGGINKPFKTIQKALDSLYGVINVLPGTYTESLNIPIGYGQYGPVIQGYGTTESPKAEVRGTLTISSGISRVRIKDLQLDGKGEGPAIIDNGSDGRHILEDVTLANAGVGNPVITVIDGKNWWTVTGSAIEGAVYLTGTPGSGANFNIAYSPNSYLCTPIIDANYIFTAFCVGKLGYITHSNGSIYCSKVGSWYPFNGKVINSTSTNPANIISVGYSTLSVDGVNFGAISSTGATVIKNYNIDSLYQDVCLSAVSTAASTLITTTASTLIAGTKKVERNISYNATNGELTFTKTGSYNITAVIKIDCTEWNKKVETWIEKWNGSAWDLVADTGIQRMFQTDQEVEINYHFSSYFVAGEKYRLRAVSDSDTTISTKTLTLTNGVKMPAIRISVFA